MRIIDLDSDRTEIFLDGKLLVCITIEKSGPIVTVGVGTDRENVVKDPWAIYDHKIVPTPNGNPDFTPPGWRFYSNIGRDSASERTLDSIISQNGHFNVMVFNGGYWKDGRFDPDMRAVWICDK